MKRTYRKDFRIYVIAVAACLGAAIAGTASAQQSGTSASASPQSNATLQEVVVTAQYRSQSILDVPMSIMALSRQTLTLRDVHDVFDFIDSIPNVSYAIGQSAYGFQGSYGVSIRGVSGGNTTGFYIDDTPVPDSIDPHIVGVDRVEVLRGPQGTLYGAQSMGGTVRIITEQPSTTQFSATTDVGVSTTDHTSDPNSLANASVNLPLIADKLGLRAEGYYDYEAGFFTRDSIPAAGTPALDASSPTPFSVSNVGRMDTSGGSLALLWQVSDDLTITPRVLYQRNASNGFPFADIYYNAAGPTPPLEPTSFDQERLFNIPEYSTDIWSLSSLTVKDHMRYGELTSSTSYFKRDIDEDENQTEFVYEVFEQPFGIGPIPSTIEAQERYRQWVEEIRFASELPGPVQFIAGLYYSDSYGNFDPANGPAAVVPGLNAASGGVLGSDVIFAQYNHTQITQPAAYGDVSWRATRKLELTVGLRGYRINTTNNSYQAGLAVGAPITGPQATTSSHGVLPKYDVEYRFTPDHTAYALASKGLRPGGFQIEIPPAPLLGCAAELAQYGLTPGDTRTFRPDSIWNYELGSKNSWDGHRFMLNGDVYYMKWTDIQQAVALACGYAFTGNAGAAKSEGTEIEADLHPLPGLNVSLGGGYEHAVITEQGSGIGALSPQLPGSPIYMVPAWTADVDANYVHALTDRYRMVYQIGYSYVGDRRSGNVDESEPRLVPAFGLLEANVGLEWSRYEVMLTGKNLTNAMASYGDDVAISAELPGRPRVAIAPPRTIGIEARAEF
jgi:iron complex outermembrane recepter protein